MSHKREGQLTVSGEWAKHLRPYLRRAFWKAERQAEKLCVRNEDLPVEAVRKKNSNSSCKNSDSDA